MTVLSQAVFSVMLLLSPPERAKAHEGWEESTEQRTQRYADIAQDIDDIVGEEGAIPGRSRAWTETLVLAVSFHESGFALDVDMSDCWQPKIGRKRCDGGRAFGIMQVHADRKYSPNMLRSRRENIRAGLRKMKQSYAMCAKSAPNHQLAAYGSGRCNVGLAGARSLYGMHARVQQLFAMRQEKEAS